MDSGITSKEQLESGHRLDIEEKSQCRSNTIKFDKGWTKRERHLTLLLFMLVSIVVILSSVIASYASNNTSKRTHSTENFSRFGKEQPQTKSDERISPTSTNSTWNVCITKGCVEAAADILKYINEEADPCENFYEFACGKYIKYTTIHDERSPTISEKIDGEIEEELKLVLEEKENRTNDSLATVLAKTLYNSCMETERKHEEGIAPLRNILRVFGGWPVVEGETWNETNFSWVDVLYKSRDLGFSISTLFDIRFTTSSVNSIKWIILIDQPNFILSREYLINGLNDTVVQAYLRYSIHVAKLLGADSSRAEEEMNQILQLQINLAKISMTSEDSYNSSILTNFITLREMDRLAPGIPWVNYIDKYLSNNLEVNETEVINVEDVNYISNMSKILENIPTRILANFIIWRIVFQAASYLSEDLRDLQFEYNKVLHGYKTRPMRWKECQTLVSYELDFAIDNLYIKNYLKEESKDQVKELAAYVRAEFDNTLRTSTWMDEETREAALKKLNGMVSHIAYPDDLLDDNKLTEFYRKADINETYSLLHNILNLRKFHANYVISRFREPTNKTDSKDWSSVTDTDAYYTDDSNSFKIPAGILQDRFFRPDRPKYMNFGAIGDTIGHEITHGFDNIGRKFDEKGELKNWWQLSTEKNFLERAKCIIDQYDHFMLVENGMKLNGLSTEAENIADNGGLNAVYGAYQNWVKDHGMEQTLPGLKYTPNQLFWISNGQTWCTKDSLEYLMDMILNDEHPPDMFRILGPAKNSEEFAKDWKCPTSSAMNPKNKCVVW